LSSLAIDHPFPSVRRGGYFLIALFSLQLADELRNPPEPVLHYDKAGPLAV
jgi:hypothetical protein